MKKALVSLSRKMSKVSIRFIWISLAIIIVPIILVPLLVSIPPLECVGRFLVDIFSPVSLRNIPYEGLGNKNSGFASALAFAIGVVLISGILIPIVTNYLRTLGDRYLDGTLDNYAWNGHTLFLGFDEMMLGTLRNILMNARRNKATERRKGWMKKTKSKREPKPIVVVAVPENVRKVRMRLEGLLSKEEMDFIEVVQCNMNDKKDLERRARAGHARQIFIIGQTDDATHDASNLKSLEHLSEISGTDSAQECYIYIRNQSSLTLIQRQGLFENATPGSLHHRAMPFNFYQSIADRLLAGFESGRSLMNPDYQNERRNLALCPGATAHLVILGMTEMGMALARETLMMIHYPGHKVKITMVDDRAREEMHYFTGRYKELFKCCPYSYTDLDTLNKDVCRENTGEQLLDVEFEFMKGGVAHPELMKLIEEWSRDDGQIMTLVVCTNESPKNMATALYLPRPLLEGANPIQVWVYQHGDDSMNEFGRHRQYKCLHTFSPSEYGGVDVSNSVAKTWAEAVSKAYSQSSGKGESKWESMSQYERWSSLYNVRSIIPKLRGIGYELEIDAGKMILRDFRTVPPVTCTSLKLTDDELQKLADTEHVRWMTEELTKGFRPTTEAEHRMIMDGNGEKERYKADRFAHDDIRPFAVLPKKTQSYDIVMTQAMVSAVNGELGKGEQQRNGE